MLMLDYALKQNLMHAFPLHHKLPHLPTAERNQEENTLGRIKQAKMQGKSTFLFSQPYINMAI